MVAGKYRLELLEDRAQCPWPKPGKRKLPKAKEEETRKKKPRRRWRGLKGKVQRPR